MNLPIFVTTDYPLSFVSNRVYSRSFWRIFNLGVKPGRYSVATHGPDPTQFTIQCGDTHFILTFIFTITGIYTVYCNSVTVSEKGVVELDLTLNGLSEKDVSVSLMINNHNGSFVSRSSSFLIEQKIELTSLTFLEYI
jgi:hypothetical protein